MFRTLRAKLIAAQVMIIAICLVLAGAFGVLWLRYYEREGVLARTRQAAQTLVRTLRALPVPMPRVPALLRQQLSGQILTTESQLLFVGQDGTILHADQDASLRGQMVPVPSLNSPQTPDARQSYDAWQIVQRRWRSSNGRAYFLLYVPLPSSGEGETLPAGQEPVHYMAIAVPVDSIYRPWWEWMPPLVAIAVVALAVSSLLAYWIARSITRPVEAMTRAAERMAEGQYGQRIPVNSRDEIGQLAAAFNRMAQEVERAQRMQRDFLANISHDLQTPLTSIRGFSQAIIEGAIRDREGFQRAGHIIYEEAERMGRLIKDLLDLARLEAGQVEMAQAPLDLAYLLRQCVAQFEARARETGVLLSLHLPEGLPVALGDSERLAQVFANLLDNALKYTPSGGRVSVEGYVLGGPSRPEAEAVSRPNLPAGSRLPPLSNGQWIVVTVSDTGIGISEEDLPRIFERFYRADKARAGKEGAGLGLAIAREIVQAHGGYIMASSQRGEGSQFHVALPATQAGWPNSKKARGESPELPIKNRSTLAGAFGQQDDGDRQ